MAMIPMKVLFGFVSCSEGEAEVEGAPFEEEIVEEAEEAGVIPEGAEEVETEAEDDTFQESRNLKNT